MADKEIKWLWLSLSGTLAIGLAISSAVAQQPPPPPAPQQKVQQENAQQTPSGKMGKEEPSSHSPSSPTAAFVNGVLAVPGAPTQTDTVPAKFSQQNAADDKLSTAAYTFKQLSPDQRRIVYQGLKNERASASAVAAEIATKLPTQVELRVVPQELGAQVPQTQGYQYLVAGDRVLLVSPPTRYVVGVFSPNE